MEFPSAFRTATALTAGILLAAGLTAPASAAQGGDLERVSLPFFWPMNHLDDLDAASPGSVWITGDQGVYTVPSIPGFGRTVPGNPVVRRWRDGGWIEYHLGGMPGHGRIRNVEAIAPENVWISGVRYVDDGSGEYEEALPYLARFTGSEFAPVEPPGGTDKAPSLQADASGVWVVNGTGVHRRTGGTWERIAPAPGPTLTAWQILAADDIWALGFHAETDVVMARHWDGEAWRTVPIESAAPLRSISDVLSVSPGEAWAVGHSAEEPIDAVVLHWTGESWTSVPAPAGLRSLDHLEQGPDGTLWALGNTAADTGAPALFRRSGDAWERVPTPAVPFRNDFRPTALAADPVTGALWVLGEPDIGGPVVMSTQ